MSYPNRSIRNLRRAVDRLAAPAALLVLAATFTPLAAQEIVEIPTLGGPMSWANAVNDSGQVAGRAETAENRGGGTWIHHAFLWRDGHILDLGTLGGPQSEALDIDAQGRVVGWAETGELTPFGVPERHAFLWEDGRMRDLGTLGGSNSYAVRINNNGQVIGSAEDAAGLPRAFFWNRGEMVDIGVLDPNNPDAWSQARALNSRFVLGVSSGGPFIWVIASRELRRHRIEWDPEGLLVIRPGDASVVDLNENDIELWANGYTRSLGPTSPPVDLGTLQPPPFDQSYARAINSHGRVVGQSRGDDGYLHAVIWNAGLFDLNDLIPPGSPWVRLDDAVDISDTAFIVGLGTKEVPDPELGVTIQPRSFVITNGPRLTGKISVHVSRAYGGKTDPGLYAGELPIRSARVFLEAEDGTNLDVTETDADGEYRLDLIGRPDQRYRLRVFLGRLDGNVYVTDVRPPGDAEVAWVRSAPFPVAGSTRRDFQFRIFSGDNVAYDPPVDLGAPGLTSSELSDFPFLAYAYHNVELAARASLDLLGWVEPVAVRAFQLRDPPVGQPRMFYDDSRQAIAIEPGRVRLNHGLGHTRPTTEFHEYGHHVMWTSSIGGRSSFPDRGEFTNHANLANETSADSWVEGFATYMALAISKEIGDARPSLWVGYNTDFDHFGWGPDNPRQAGVQVEHGDLTEEFAIASVLWQVHKEIGGFILLSILQERGESLDTWKDVYEALRSSEPVQREFEGISCHYPTGAFKSGIDCVFIDHGFYHDEDGDGLYDEGEQVGVTRWGGRPATVFREDVPDIFGSLIAAEVVDAATGAPLESEGLAFHVRIEYEPEVGAEGWEYWIPATGEPPYAFAITVPGVPSRAWITAEHPAYGESAPLPVDWAFFHERVDPGREGGVDPVLLAHTFVMGGDAPGAEAFRRGDANGDGQVDISDPITVLGHLFAGAPAELACGKSADSNDDGQIDIADPIFTLAYVFLGAAAPRAPFPDCGEDVTADFLTCESYTACP